MRLTFEAIRFTLILSALSLSNCILANHDANTPSDGTPQGSPPQDGPAYSDIQLLQARCEWRNPLPQGNALVGIDFPNGTTGYLVGARGTILKTSDAGRTWTLLASGFLTDLNGAHFPSPKYGFVVGNYGLILKTTDGGATWTSKLAGRSSLRSVCGVNGSDVYVLGDDQTLLKSADSGSTWVLQTAGPNFNPYSCASLDTYGAPGDPTDYAPPPIPISQANGDTAYEVLEDRRIMRTVDGGKSWTNSSASVTSANLHAVRFATALTGFVVGDAGTILKTRDGGASWDLLSGTSSADLYAVDFLDSITGWVVGSNGMILHTRDGGKTWEPQNASTDTYLQAVKIVDAKTVYIGGGVSKLLKTTDGGNTWNVINGSPQEVTSIEIRGNGIFTGGIEGIHASLDGGATWTSYSEHIFDLSSTHFIDEKNVLAPAPYSSYGQESPSLYITSDGATWVQNVFRNWDDPVTKLLPRQSDSGFAVGGTSFYKYTRGGRALAALKSPSADPLNDLACPETRVCIAVGVRGTILKISL